VLVISPSQRPIPNNSQQSQEIGIRASCRNRTRNPSRRTAADLRLRPRGQWDWLQLYICLYEIIPHHSSIYMMVVMTSSRTLLSLEFWIQSRSRPCGIHGEQNWHWDIVRIRPVLHIHSIVYHRRYIIVIMYDLVK
jgi:hypothetical protein